MAAAVVRLGAQGILAPDAARHLGRVARGELVTVRSDLRAVLYASVLAVVTGVGILLGKNLERIGPLTIALAVAVAAAALFVWVFRHAVPFAWSRAEPEHPAFDYLLVLALLLVAADLAYVEVQFTALGPGWPYHLLLVSVLMAVAAFRYDSRAVFGMALTTFAGWRGVAVGVGQGALLLPWSSVDDAVRVNAGACGFLFVGLGALLRRHDRKAHFETVAVHLGWMLILGALLSGLGKGGSAGIAFAFALLAVGGGLAAFALRGRRMGLFVLGVLAAYCGVTTLVFREGIDSATGALFYIVITCIALVAALVRVHRRWRIEE